MTAWTFSFVHDCFMIDFFWVGPGLDIFGRASQRESRSMVAQEGRELAVGVAGGTSGGSLLHAPDCARGRLAMSHAPPSALAALAAECRANVWVAGCYSGCRTVLVMVPL